MPSVKAIPAKALTRRIGLHLSIAGGMHHALEAALRLRCPTLQVFVKNQRQWHAPPLQADDLARWHVLRSTPGFGPVIAHATYLINLAAADRALLARSRAALADELQRCDALAIPALVLHPGAAGDGSVSAAIRRAAESINRAYGARRDLRAAILLETTAGQGRSLGRSFEELADIIAAVEQPERVGVCIDTCHVFAAGWDIRRPEVVCELVARAAATVGLPRVRCWHLNDSKTDCGSRVDRHEHIGRGRIGTAGFRNVLADPRFADVPLILETPKGTDAAGRDYDRLNLARVRALAARINPTRHAEGRKVRTSPPCPSAKHPRA